MRSETIIPDEISQDPLFTKILSMRVDATSVIRVGFLVKGINEILALGVIVTI